MNAIASAVCPPILPPCLIGEVARFVDQDDWLSLRGIDTPTRQVIDRQIVSLRFSAQDAYTFFERAWREGWDLRRFETLSITNADAASLQRLAELIQRAAARPFHLVLDFADSIPAHVDALQPFATLRLSCLTISNMMLSHAKLQSLASTTYPIAIDCPNAFLVTHRAVLHLRTLIALCLPSGHLTSDDIESIARHPRIRSVRNLSERISSADLARILSNPRLEALACWAIEPWRAADATCLSDHPSLREITMGNCSRPQIEAVAQNQRIARLTLSACTDEGLATLPQLANMPALRMLSVSAATMAMQPAHVALLCAKPLDLLHASCRHGAGLERDTLCLLASANVVHLKIDHLCLVTGQIDNDIVETVVRNRALTQLTITSSVELAARIIAGGAARLAACPQIRHLCLTLASNSETKEGVEAVWIAAGKSILDLSLKLVVRPLG